MANKRLPFLTESSEFKPTPTIGSFQNGVTYNSFDDNYGRMTNEYASSNIDLLRDADKIIKSNELYEGYRDELISSLVENCASWDVDTHGNPAMYAEQVKAMLDNRRDMIVNESFSVGQVLPIKMIDFPLIVKDHLKNVIKDIMQCEVTKSPIVKKQIQRIWIVDPKTNKRYAYPQCFYRNQFKEIFEAGKGVKLAHTDITLPAFNYDIIGTLAPSVTLPKREKLSLNTKIISGKLATGEVVPLDMRIELSSGAWLGGLVDTEVESTATPHTKIQVKDCLTGMVDFVNNTMSLTSASGQIKSVVLDGYLSNDLNERSVTFDYTREEHEWKIEDGHRVNIPYSIEDLEDSKALVDLDLYKESYSNLAEYLVNMEDADGLGWLDEMFQKYDGVTVDPLEWVGFVKKQTFDCVSTAATTALPCEYIQTMLKFLIDRFVIDIADTAKLEDVTFVLYGNPRYVSLLGDEVNWVVKNSDTVGGIRLTYGYGIMNSGAVKIQVVSSDKIMANDHKGLRIIPFPTSDTKMTMKHIKYTSHILTAANSAYRDPNRPGGSYTNIMGVSRYTNAGLQAIQGHINFVNEDKYIKI